MLMTRILRRIRRDDEGAALAAVLGVMLVGVLLTTLIASSVVSAYGYSSMTRAGIESQAAAESGIAVARAGLINGTCNSAFNSATHPSTGVYTSAPGEVPEFTATIYTKQGSGWSTNPSCPASASVDVRIVVTGAAEATGAAQMAAGDIQTLEAVLTAPTIDTEITNSGPAVFGYAGGSFGEGAKLLTESGVPIDVIFRTGNITCDGGMAAVTNLVVGDGNLLLTGGCGVSGTAWVSKTATVDGGATIGGNIRAQDVVLKNGTLKGDIHALNNFSIPSGWPTVNGNVTAKKINVIGGVFTKGLWSYTDLQADNGNFSTTRVVSRTAIIKPSWLNIPNTEPPTYPATPSVSPWEVPPAPVVPNWIDFPYNPSLWAGFFEYDLGTNCSRANINAAITFFAGRPGILNALNCANLALSSGEDQFTFTNDVVIYAKKFDLGGGAAFRAGAASGTNQRLWLINPDQTPNGSPTCNSQQLKIGGGFQFTAAPATWNVMFYSPCDITIASSTTFKGQIFSNNSTFGGGASMTYAGVGLPGYDLSTGNSTAETVTESKRRIEYVRKIEG